jgi:hypothetical protein
LAIQIVARWIEAFSLLLPTEKRYDGPTSARILFVGKRKKTFNEKAVKNVINLRIINFSWFLKVFKQKW